MRFPEKFNFRQRPNFSQLRIQETTSHSAFRFPAATKTKSVAALSYSWPTKAYQKTCHRK
jgi:hypothetical protein